MQALSVAVLAVAFPAASSASILFTNLGAGNSYDVTEGNLVGNDFAGDNLGEGDTFSPVADGKLASLWVALSCVVGCPASETFTIALTGDSGDSPGAVIETWVFTSVTLGGLGNNNALIVATSGLNPLLHAGTHYWVTVVSSTDFSIAWNNDSTGDTSDQAVSSDGGATWFSPSGATPSAYQVNGVDVVSPEPSTVLLLASGLLLSLLWSRFVRRGV